ncbi:hypothetical protein BP5796_05665 [Coleophoma crateriformis]|uniref:Uncharacterized protein n=1 Tax=Coleophoma crateriformis TaxID=565419 RepID=A0A3D8S3T0_9HELO|nr:hypothetical protein BP5796_05665 [Coleophoma crateriformis]
MAQSMDALSLSSALDNTTAHIFPFLALPAEIRNKIYAFAWVGARDKDSTYNLPDVVVTSQGLRWTNISTGFALFRASKQVRSESLAAVSRECFAEVKLFPDPYEMIAQAARPRVIAHLQSAFFGALSQESRCLSLDISSQRWKHWACDVLVSAVVHALEANLRKLKEVTIKLDASNCDPLEMVGVKDVFRLARKKGVVLTFEMFYKPQELFESKNTWEKMICFGAEACGVPDAEVPSCPLIIWIEWTRTLDEPHLEPGCVCGNCYRG